MNDKKIVLIIGAGATVAEVSSRAQKNLPPLDKGFFSQSLKLGFTEINKIVSYFDNVYHLNILDFDNDSLEKIMTIIYTDIWNPSKKDQSEELLLILIKIFNKILAKTTNDIKTTPQGLLYRIIVKYLGKGINPNNITIITFNQDLQIEKVLDRIEKIKRWNKSGKIFNFPACYKINFNKITNPKTKKCFDVSIIKPELDNTDGIKILKLHGSLNWYSTHNSSKVGPNRRFKTDRPIKLTKRIEIDPEMKYVGGKRKQYTFPVIVPPLTHKSAILHNELHKIWVLAEEALNEANKIIIYGYSCPPLDFESSNLIQKSLKGKQNNKIISIINPDPNVLKRYAELIDPKSFHYFSLAKYFLKQS